MKLSTRDNRNAVSALRLSLTLSLALVLPLLLFGSAPSWWSHRRVFVENAAPDDYAPANHGQLKNIAKAAVTEMDAKLSTGAGDELHNLINSWSPPNPAANDFAPLNAGQLKNVARIFYDRLIALRIVDHYPWLTSTDPPDDFAVANIGQVKALFSFQIPTSNILNDPLADRIAAGEHSANLALEANAVWSWHSNAGTVPDFDRNYPRRVPGLSGIRSVSAGDSHLAALTIDGLVLTWGENNAGQLGDGTSISRDTPALVPNLTNITSVKAGGRHTLALQQDGTLVSWGDNYYGQLGTGNTAPSSVPQPIIGLDNVRKIAAGYERSVALTNDGIVWTWGYDHYAAGDIFALSPSPVPDFFEVVDVAAGYEHNVAVKTDGTVWAWGTNYYDQIGNGSSPSVSQATPAQVLNLTEIVKVASSNFHSLALKADGTVWAWGANFSAQLGDGTRQRRQAPVQVTGLTNVIAIATGSSYSLAMKTDGTVWTWGDGATGTLSGADLSVPQQVGLGLFDNNHNGMDDRWELQYLGSLDQSADADFDGDGFSNRLEFLRGTNPADYFNGVSPVIEIAGGNNQIGQAGAFLPKPFKVRVRNPEGALLVNAPVTFKITEGGGALAPASGGAQQQQLSARTDVNGEALAFHVLPDVIGISTRTTVSAGSSASPASVTFRGITSFKLPATPTPSPTPPDPNATPTPPPSPTAIPVAPYRYAIIDLGKDRYPIRINNRGQILIVGNDDAGNWGNFRWKGGVMERLTYAGSTQTATVKDMNDEGIVVGYVWKFGAWIKNGENERQAGLTWPSEQSEAVKTSAPVAAQSWGFNLPGTVKQAFFAAINNGNDVFGGVRTSGGYESRFRNEFAVYNAFRWSNGAATQLSFADATFVPATNSFVLSGVTDEISRANRDGHYIGTQLTPQRVSSNPAIVEGTRTGMIDGQSVSFFPADINEAGIVAGSSGANMIVYSSPASQVTITGASPLAINDHSRPAPSSVPQPSPAASASPTPIPIPQILAWAGNALAIWERQQDQTTWHPFGLEEMIPSMEGWTYLEPYDMNDSGLIVGIGWYADPAILNAQGEYHAFMLVPVGLMVDGNRDGEMSFDDPVAQDADKTSEEKPYRFWVNDDDDGASGDPQEHVPPSVVDYTDSAIRSIRDLEDFARLHTNVGPLAEALENGSLRTAFEWRQSTGDPRIKIYRATAGSTSYLESQSAASAHLLFPFRDTLGEVVKGLPLFLPSDFWVSRSQFTNVPKTLPVSWFIFEASGEGKGELTISLWKETKKIAEMPGVVLRLENVKRMFQRAKGTPLNGVSEPWSNENPLPTDYIGDPNGYDFEEPEEEKHDAIIFVHGIHPPSSNGDDSYLHNVNSAETTFKRLWHSGYKGRVAFYKWPALNPAGYFLNGTGFEFNQSEYRAFKYGKGLARFAENLPNYYDKHIYAHSQGNAVVAAAFRNYGLKAKSWIVTQGAIPISCFDESPRHYIFSYVTPDTAANLGYRGFLDNHVQTRIVNFCNNQDTVTGKIWELNHQLFKPMVHLTGLSRIEYWFFSAPSEVHVRRFLGNAEVSDRSVNDPHESMAMAVKSRSRAIAHGVDVQGKVDEIVDLQAAFGFGDEHGSQWERPIQQGPLLYFQGLADETR